MKNLLIYISPTKSFDNPRPDLASNDAGPLAKVQYENSLELGWKKEDIMLFTNFPFKYGDLSATVLNKVEFFERKPQVSKINAIVRLFEKGYIKERETYWFHDLDAFQLRPLGLGKHEVNISNDQIAVTEYGGLSFLGGGRLSTGIIFFRSGSKDIFVKIKELAYKKKIDEEEALGILISRDKNIRDRVKKLNYSHNFIGYNLRSTYTKATKPLKVAHFHPMTGKKRLGTNNALRFFKGDNPIKTPLITSRLVRILKYHRIG